MDPDPTEQLPQLDPDPGFYQRALRRIPRWMVLVTLAALPFVWRRGGSIYTASFVVGAIGGFWNYVAVCRLAERLSRTAGAPRRAGLRTFLRLLFIGLAVFVIIRFTRINLVAAFMGLFTPVAAVVIEILYELSFDRGKS